MGERPSGMFEEMKRMAKKAIIPVAAIGLGTAAVEGALRHGAEAVEANDMTAETIDAHRGVLRSELPQHAKFDAVIADFLRVLKEEGLEVAGLSIHASEGLKAGDFIGDQTIAVSLSLNDGRSYQTAIQFNGYGTMAKRAIVVAENLGSALENIANQVRTIDSPSS